MTNLRADSLITQSCLKCKKKKTSLKTLDILSFKALVMMRIQTRVKKMKKSQVSLMELLSRKAKKGKTSSLTISMGLMYNLVEKFYLLNNII